MFLSRFSAIASIAAVAEACSQCVHPGDFTGSVSLFWNTTVICTSELPEIAASIPASFWTPRDQAPCLMKIIVTNPDTGANVIASVVSQEANAVGNNILLTTAGLAGLAPDKNPNHAPATVAWTFSG